MSILTDVKKLVGIPESNSHFDDQIIIFTNNAFSKLYSIGVGKDKFMINKDTTWENTGFNETDVEELKAYFYVKVKLLFDPPQHSFTLSAMEKVAEEMEFRLGIEYDTNE